MKEESLAGWLAIASVNDCPVELDKGLASHVHVTDTMMPEMEMMPGAYATCHVVTINASDVMSPDNLLLILKGILLVDTSQPLGPKLVLDVANAMSAAHGFNRDFRL